MALVTGRIDGRALSTNQNRYVQTASLGNLADILVGVAVNPTVMHTNDAEQRLVSLYEGSNLGLNVRLTLGGELAVYKNATQLQVTSGLGLTVGQWRTIELHVHAHASTGAYTLKLNGSTVLSATNVSTVASSNAYYNSVRVGPASSVSSYCAFDDLYIRDDSTFLLDWKITTRFPVSDVGPNDGTPSSGSDNFAMVDDAAPDGDTTYLGSGSGNVDRFGFDPIGTGQVHAVVMNIVCRETDANPFSVTLHANGDGAAQAIGSTSYVMRSEIFEVNPDTSNPWTPSEVNSGEFGFEIT
jgi:hypothetical protein